MKVAVLGLDGLFPGFLETFSGDLPNLNRLVKEGLSAPLLSTIPPYTPQAWTTMVTGVNPGKHGIAGFTICRGAERTIVNRTAIRTKQLWDYATGEGLEVGLLNVPLSFPAPRVHGFAVSGMLTPSVKIPGFTFPQALSEKLMERVPDYCIDTAVRKADTHRKPALRKLSSMLKSRLSCARLLLGEYKVDVFFCVFVVLDRIFHLYFRYLDPEDELFDTSEGENLRKWITPLLRDLDNFAGELAGNSGTVLIVSDHGFRAEEGKFYTKRFLEKHGFLKLQSSFKGKTGQLLITILGKERLRHILPSFLIQKGLESGERAEGTGRAFASQLTSQGVVVPQEEDRTEILGLLKGLKDPRDDRDLATGLYLREDVYSGPELDRFPHIVLELRNGGIEVSPHLVGKDFLSFVPESWPGGHHDRTGVFAAYGRGVKASGPSSAGISKPQGTGKQGERLGGNTVRMEDVLPALLSLLGLPVPEQLDGRAFIAP